MSTVELDDFMAFNDQLMALSEAGVPVGAGEEIPDGNLPAMLSRINALVARQVSRGDAVEAVIENGDRVPAWYRNLIVTGLKSDDLNASLQEFSRVASSADESRYVNESALFYPFIVCGLAYLGLIGCCLFFVPHMESAYTSFEIEPGTGLVFLQKVRDTLPIWIALPPIIFLFWIVLRWRRRSFLNASAGGTISRLLGLISGTSQSVQQQQCAHFAETMASLEKGNVPLDQALAISAGGCSDASLAESARALAENAASGEPLNADSPEAQRIPPFLRWALLQSDATVGRGRAMHMAAALYRDASNYSIQRAKIVAPMLGVVLIGGTVTLLYGLTLFVPLTQMLKAVAMPR